MKPVQIHLSFASFYENLTAVKIAEIIPFEPDRLWKKGDDVFSRRKGEENLIIAEYNNTKCAYRFDTTYSKFETDCKTFIDDFIEYEEEIKDFCSVHSVQIALTFVFPYRSKTKDFAIDNSVLKFIGNIGGYLEFVFLEP